MKRKITAMAMAVVMCLQGMMSVPAGAADEWEDEEWVLPAEEDALLEPDEEDFPAGDDIVMENLPTQGTEEDIFPEAFPEGFLEDEEDSGLSGGFPEDEADSGLPGIFPEDMAGADLPEGSLEDMAEEDLPEEPLEDMTEAELPEESLEDMIPSPGASYERYR